jgi:predicted double-glycine peptidase
VTPPPLIPVPLARQATNYTCGVAALQSVLAYYGIHVRQDRLAEALQADPEQGTNYHAMMAYAQAHGLQAEAHIAMKLAGLQQLLDAGWPVIVALQAWADAPVDYVEDWDDGHYAVAVGYDEERIYFMDPSTLGNYTYIPVAEFLARWHDMYLEQGEPVRLVHFGLVIGGVEPNYDPQAVVLMR